MSQTLCLCGLGNPGQAYAQHRHNLGALLCEAFLDSLGISYSLHGKTKILHAIFSQGDKKIHIVRLPKSYMNESGRSLLPYLNFYQIPPESVVIAHDDLDLPFGALRFKRGGGSGGHNGLKDLTHYLKTSEYWRIRIGIGRPPVYQEVADYVLSPLSPSEQKAWPNVLTHATIGWPELAALDHVRIQQLWHSSTP